MNPRSLFYVEKWPGVDFRWGSLFVVTPALVRTSSQLHMMVLCCCWCCLWSIETNSCYMLNVLPSLNKVILLLYYNIVSTLKYDVVSMLKNDVVSTLKYDVVSTWKSDVVSTWKSNVVSTLKTDVETTLKYDVVSTLKNYVVSTLKYDVVSMWKSDVKYSNWGAPNKILVKNIKTYPSQLAHNVVPTLF